jgi:SAM-dependent methyltransferase
MDEFRFTEGAAYERFMGPWTRAAGLVFLDWLAVPQGLAWLDVGCGTGVFTEILEEAAKPAKLVAIDPARAQISYAAKKPVAQHAVFQIGDAQALPFPDASFDVVASALVLNFIPNQALALAEMRRVTRKTGCVAGYVWDFTGPLSVTRHITSALRAIKAKAAPVPEVESTRLCALQDLFKGAGLTGVETEVIDVEVAYPNFDAYWRRFIDNPSPGAAFIKAMTETGRETLRASVEASLPTAADGGISFVSRANAARGFAPD